MLTAAGLMSGTSADGISVAVVEFGRRRMKIAVNGTIPHSRRLRERIAAAACGEARTEELSRLHADLGRAFGRAAEKVIGRRRVNVIGSHGQTVWHESGRHTLQLGEASFIAEQTGVTTVSDFRPAHLAAGGEGAPLVPYFDWACFGGRPVILLNLGGIANLTIVGRTLRETRGFDTGPANALIDEAMRLAYGKDMDRNGRVARSGRIDERLLRKLDHPWFSRRPPKSTGKQLFGREFLVRRLGRELRRRPADVIATLTCHAALTIARAHDRFAPRGIQELIVSGGGALNPVLMEHLEVLFWPVAVRPSDVYGIPVMAREAAAFALLAVEAVRGEAASTGTRRPTILGKISPGKGFKRLVKRLLT